MMTDMFAICERFQEDEYGQEWFPEEYALWDYDYSETKKRFDMFKRMGNTQDIAVCRMSMTPWEPV